MKRIQWKNINLILSWWNKLWTHVCCCCCWCCCWCCAEKKVPFIISWHLFSFVVILLSNGSSFLLIATLLPQTVSQEREKILLKKRKERVKRERRKIIIKVTKQTNRQNKTKTVFFVRSKKFEESIFPKKDWISQGISTLQDFNFKWVKLFFTFDNQTVAVYVK